MICAWQSLSLAAGSLNAVQNTGSAPAQEIADLGHCRFELLVVHGFSVVFIDCRKDLKVGVLKFLLKPTFGFLGGLPQ